MDRPRIGVLGYGSILNPEELSFLDGGRDRATPVRVEGFRRVFNQEASWRDAADEKRAVLNVTRDGDARCNAVLLSDLARDEYADYRERERGYRLVEVETDAISAYGAADADVDGLDLVLIAVGEKADAGIEPIPSYLDVCLSGAREWGTEFEREFVETTETADGTPLAEYLSRTPGREL